MENTPQKNSKSKSKKLIQSLRKRSNGPTSKKHSTGSTKIRGMETRAIGADTDISRYIPQLPSDMVVPKSWELQNRKSFYQWLMDSYGKYESGDPVKRRVVAAEGLAENPKRKVKQLLPIQKLVRDLNSTYSPYRGMLLFYGLGVGKTISAIAVSEAIHNRKGVVVMSKTALEGNFISNIKKGGQDYMIQNNYWVFCKNTNDTTRDLYEKLGIPAKIVNENGGFYLIDFSVKDSNYNDLPSQHRNQLEAQIDAMISDRFKFIHTDDTRLARKVKQSDFDDKVVIVDEVHNLTNNMTKPGGSGAILYDMFMKAKNAKFIFLTGTPIINKVYEASRLFNILRGYIPYIEFKFQTVFGAGVDFKKLKAQLLQNRNIDQIVISTVNKSIKITKNPDGYLTSRDPSAPGVIYAADKSIAGELQTMEQLRDSVDLLFKTQGFKYTVTMELEKETALPEDEDEFEKLFYNPELNKLKKTDLFKKRIAGLTSYYDYKDPDLFPSVNNNGRPYLVMCPMSDYQLGHYETFRHEEILKDKKAARRKRDEDNISSTYRIASRMACTFVYPDDMPNPYDQSSLDLYKAQGEQMAVLGEDQPELDLENEKAVERFVKERLLKTLRRDKAKYFSVKEGGMLPKLSPKYTAMVNNMQREKGCSLVYSYFKTLIGLNMFSLALEATGEWERFKIKKIGEFWHLVTDNPDVTSSMRSTKDKHELSVPNKSGKPKKRYVFYSGDEDYEYKSIIPFIFNSEFDRLPNSCAPLIESLKKIYGAEQNLHGQIIKCMMTTRTGAEGLDLKHVRNVHISEPYWQPVLIEQVIGRAVRTNSHTRLPPDERNVSVYIYMATIPSTMVNKLSHVDVRQDVAKYNDGLDKKGKVITSDEFLFITSERKKVIVGELLNVIKDAAVDCTLNYADNIKQSPGIVCLDYETKDRDDYLFTPGLEETQDIINIKQEYTIAEQYTKLVYGGKTYYFNTFPTSDGKTFIYDETVLTKTRKPNPVGQILYKDGKMKVGFYATKKK